MNKISKLVLVMSSALLITSCSSDSSDPAPLVAPIGDISGGWSIFETAISSNSECNGTSAYDVTVTQNVNSITATGTAGGSVSGTLSGSALSLSGTRPEDPGIVTYSSITATIPADCSSFTANTTWSYSETGFSCSGTSTMEATRTSGATTC